MIYSDTQQLIKEIKNYMNMRDIKIVDLAKKIGCPANTLSQLMRQPNITLEKLNDICKALDCDLEINLIEKDDHTNQEETYYNVALAARNETLRMNKKQMDEFAKSANNAPNNSRNHDMF